MKSSPHLLQLKKSPHNNKDPAHPKRDKFKKKKNKKSPANAGDSGLIPAS